MSSRIILTETTARAARAGCAAVVMLVIASLPTRAATVASAEAAAAFVHDFGMRATAMLSDRELSSEARAREFRRLFLSRFAVDSISRFVLGKNWRRASESELVEYRGLFENYIVATYARRMKDYQGETLTLGAARLEKHGLALVGSWIERPNGSPIAVDWRLRHAEGRWQIVDIVIEGASLVITQRSEFSAVIRSSGGRVDGLLEKLREATADGGAGPKVARSG